MFPPSRSLLAGLALALLLVAPSCASLPGMQDSSVTLSPRYYRYELRGKARMQSVSGGSIVENAPVSASQLGQNHHDDDIGAVLAIGDGFSGFDLEYQKIEIEDTSAGVLTSDFGRLPSGTIVNSEFAMDEYRVGYVAELFDHEFELSDDDYLRIRIGPGLTVAHREGKLKVISELDPIQNENLKFGDDGVPYLGLRARAEWRSASLQIDWDYNPDLTFGGDFDGELHDVEVLGRYGLESQVVTFLAGYRWSDLQMTSTAVGLRYDTDFRMEGWVLGVEFRF